MKFNGYSECVDWNFANTGIHEFKFEMPGYTWKRKILNVYWSLGLVCIYSTSNTRKETECSLRIRGMHENSTISYQTIPLLAYNSAMSRFFSLSWRLNYRISYLQCILQRLTDFDPETGDQGQIDLVLKFLQKVIFSHQTCHDLLIIHNFCQGSIYWPLNQICLFPYENYIFPSFE